MADGKDRQRRGEQEDQMQMKDVRKELHRKAKDMSIATFS